MGPKLLSVLLSFQRAGRDGAAPIGLNGTRLNWVEHCESSFEELRTATMDEVVWVPLSKVRTVYGLAMTPEQHPFVRYLRDGFTSLLSFYRIHQPSSLPELFFLPNTSFLTSSESHSTRTWPWGAGSTIQHFVNKSENSGGNHDRDKRAWSDARRLDSVHKSVLRHGFWMPKFDSPSYFLLVNDCSEKFDFRVVLIQGAHRTSVLSFLGWKIIPMTPECAFGTPEVRLSDLSRWPGVSDGSFSKNSARELFEVFFRDEKQVLLSGW